MPGRCRNAPGNDLCARHASVLETAHSGAHRHQEPDRLSPFFAWAPAWRRRIMDERTLGVALEPTDFYQSHLRSTHAALLAHPVTLRHLGGKGIRLDGRMLAPNGHLDPGMGKALSTREFAHLLCVFNHSRVHAQVLRHHLHETPSGLYFSVINNRLIQGPHKNRFGLCIESGTATPALTRSLHIDCMCLSAHAPPGLGTIAFALCAVTAHLAKLSRISLVAAGGRGFKPPYVGYRVWPKFGFDAAVTIEELANTPHLQGCRTVQDILAEDASWWESRGTQRMMTFDLSAGSASWRKLLRYLGQRLTGGPHAHHPRT